MNYAYEKNYMMWAALATGAGEAFETTVTQEHFKLSAEGRKVICLNLDDSDDSYTEHY